MPQIEKDENLHKVLKEQIILWGDKHHIKPFEVLAIELGYRGENASKQLHQVLNANSPKPFYHSMFHAILKHLDKEHVEAIAWGEYKQYGLNVSSHKSCELSEEDEMSELINSHMDLDILSGEFAKQIRESLRDGVLDEGERKIISRTMDDFRKAAIQLQGMMNKGGK